jgi:hypothetical protein
MKRTEGLALVLGHYVGTLFLVFIAIDEVAAVIVAFVAAVGLGPVTVALAGASIVTLPHIPRDT